MQSSHLRTIWVSGIAIFSMFFGAGNVIFPLKIGLESGEQFPYAITGLLLTAIGGPILGLVTALLFRGNCLDFFCRPGRIIGMGFITTSLILLGPFAVIPRCFVVAQSAIPFDLDSFTFSLIFGGAALFCCLRQSMILPLLGKVFSPVLILSLLCIIAGGLLTGGPLPESSINGGEAFARGLEEGFDTMDLISAIFFSSSIWALLSLRLMDSDEKKIARTAIFAGVFGGLLLGFVYVGLGFATALHGNELGATAPEKLMPALSMFILGPIWGQIANIAIALACFTTVISLTQTIAALCSRDFFPGFLNYRQALLGIIVTSIGFANLGFATISSLIHPLISICYPAIIVLTLCNLIHKIYGMDMIKRPVYGTFVSSAIAKSIHLLGIAW